MSNRIFKVGVNDANYQVSQKELVDGVYVEVWRCPHYRKWYEMLRRCYSNTYKKSKPAYDGVEVYEEWKVFSNFLSWSKTQIGTEFDTERLVLDKDFTDSKSKIYSPETCCYITQEANKLLTFCKMGENVSPRFTKNSKGYSLRINNHLKGKRYQAGYSDSLEGAYTIYISEKSHILEQLLQDQPNEVSKKILRDYKFRGIESFEYLNVAGELIKRHNEKEA